MCGFAGVFSCNGKPVEEKTLVAMRETIRHRGPDDSGLFVSRDKKLGFGFRRLAILDLTAAGHQPMSDSEARFWIVFNGEIYNFKELRQELEVLGHQFHSQSDTEVLLALYKEYGQGMLEKLRGMFAFAIWDEKERSLFLARDRAGKKPLYWTQWQGHFIFASEIKAILEFPGVPKRLNEASLPHYFTFLTTPAPLTLFEGVNKLGNGLAMSVKANGTIHTFEYWDPLVAASKMPAITDFTQARERVRESLRESIRYRMISDVPFGVFLSGGIDSSANVALMSELMSEPVQTFSVGYPNEVDYGELAWARLIAKEFKTNHHEIIISERDLIEFLPQMVFYQDEPLADPVCAAVYFVSKLARDNGVIVCQVGEGSDELFGGYPAWMQALKVYKLCANPVGRFLARAGLPIIEGALHFFNRGATRLEWLRRGAKGDVIFWGGAETFGEDLKQGLFDKAFWSRIGGFSSWEIIRRYWDSYNQSSLWKHPLQWMAYLDLKFRLPELLLMRVDKMSMANSLETRVPFLDHHFIELALSIDPELRVYQHQTKGLLKEAVKGIIPESVIKRPKQGFAVPIDKWFWGALGTYTSDILSGLAQNTDYFDRESLARFANRRDALSWHLLNFALWHKRWIEGEKQFG